MLPPADIQELINRNHAVVVGTISAISEPVRELPYFTTEKDFADRPVERWPYIEVVYYDITIEEVLLDDGNIRDNARLRLMDSFWPVVPQLGERYHQTLKRDVNQVPYEMPSDLEEALAAFVNYYNYRRYHKALGNVTPADMIEGRRERILQRRREVKAQTIDRRRFHNRTLREFTQALPHP